MEILLHQLFFMLCLLIKKRFAFIILLNIILCFGIVEGVRIGVSPDKLKFSGEVGEKICNNFTLFGENLVFYGNLVFNNKQSKNINDYKLTSEELWIESEFAKIGFSGINSLCLKSYKKGDYFGAILFNVPDTIYGVGIWIELNITGKEPISLFTGNSIRENNGRGLFLLLIIVFVLLFVFLIFLLGSLFSNKFS